MSKTLYDIPSISDFLINANDFEGKCNNKFDLLDRVFFLKRYLSDLCVLRV